MLVEGTTFKVGKIEWKATRTEVRLNQADDGRIEGRVWVQGAWVNGDFAGEVVWFSLDTIVANINAGVFNNPYVLSYRVKEPEPC